MQEKLLWLFSKSCTSCPLETSLRLFKVYSWRMWRPQLLCGLILKMSADEAAEASGTLCNKPISERLPYAWDQIMLFVVYELESNLIIAKVLRSRRVGYVILDPLSFLFLFLFISSSVFRTCHIIQYHSILERCSS
jgi:hypothetical protein